MTFRNLIHGILIEQGLMYRTLCLCKSVICTWVFVHCTIISLSSLQPEAQTLIPAFWINPEHLPSRKDSPEFCPKMHFLFASLSSIYKFSALAKINYSSLLLFNLLLFVQVVAPAAIFTTLGPSMVSTSSTKPFLILLLA